MSTVTEIAEDNAKCENCTEAVKKWMWKIHKKTLKYKPCGRREARRLEGTWFEHWNLGVSVEVLKL
jgi:hypothetical protein